MKHLFLLVAVAILLVGCGLSIAAEGTTASIGSGIEKGGTGSLISPAEGTQLKEVTDVVALNDWVPEFVN